MISSDRRSTPVRFTFRSLLLLLLFTLLVAACAETGPDEDIQDVQPQDQTDAFDERRFFEDPNDYLGQEVTVNGEVTEVIRPRAFRFARQDGGATSLLVVSAQEANAEEGQVVRVTGTVLRFDVPEWVRDFGQDVGLDFNDPAFQQFVGQPAIVAQSITVVEGADPDTARETATPGGTTATPTARTP